MIRSARSQGISQIRRSSELLQLRQSRSLKPTGGKGYKFTGFHRCARCITRNSFPLRFLLRSSHCPVDSHHDCVFSFRVRGGLFHVVIALQRIVMAFLKASLVQRTRVKINSVSLLLHLGSQSHRLRSELMPPTATVVAAEIFVVSGCWCHTVVAAENSYFSG